MRTIRKYRFNELLVSTQEEMENELILGLRKLSGIDVAHFNKKYGKDIFDVFKIEEAINKGYLEYENGCIYISENNIYIMNEILNMIL